MVNPSGPVVWLSLAVVVASVSAAVPVNTKTMKNFGHSIKNGKLVANTEIDLFEHTCGTPPCTITQIHCPAAGPAWYDAVVRFYIDGDEPINMTLLELANEGYARAYMNSIHPPHPSITPSNSQSLDRSRSVLSRLPLTRNHPSLALKRPNRAWATASITDTPQHVGELSGTAGQSCDAVCGGHQLQCSPSVNTGWGVDEGKSLQTRLATFNASILKCPFKPADDKWWAPDQPNFVCGNDPNAGLCVGWESVPAAVSCEGTFPASCRVCHCVAKAAAPAPQAAPPGTGDHGPWGIGLFGHTANNGGVYSTVRIPFQKTFKATLTSSQGGTYWFIVRGVEDYPVVIGDLELPPQAKLKVHRFNSLTTEGELITLMNVSAGTSGAVLSVRFDAKTTTSGYGYLEACMRALIDGATSPLFLSSGAEDYFLSAYYFNEGEFKTPNSGLTYYDGKGVLSVYKIHDRDPLLWDNGFALVFRNMEDTTSCGDLEHCPNQFCKNGTRVDDGIPPPPFAATSGGATDAFYNTVVMTYEWPRGAAVRGQGRQPATEASTEALDFVIQLGKAGLIDSVVEVRLAKLLGDADPSATAVVQRYAKAADLHRSAEILSKMYT